jgi:hypothetical protein
MLVYFGADDARRAVRLMTIFKALRLQQQRTNPKKERQECDDQDSSNISRYAPEIGDISRIVPVFLCKTVLPKCGLHGDEE